jgi:hypothetical protein
MKFCKSLVVAITSFIICTSVFGEIDPKKKYKIRPLGLDKVYDVSGCSGEDCAKIILWEDHGGKNQLFQFQPTPYGTYKIFTHRTFLFDICNNSEENGAQLIQFHCKNNLYRGAVARHKNQEFYVSRFGGNIYRITNVKSGMSLGFDEDDNVKQYIDWTNSTLVELEEEGTIRVGSAGHLLGKIVADIIEKRVNK